MEAYSALLALCGWNSPVTGEFPHKANDAEPGSFLCSPPEQTVAQAIDTPVIWDAMALIMTSL